MHVIDAWGTSLVKIDFPSVARGRRKEVRGTCYKFRYTVATIIAYRVHDHSYARKRYRPLRRNNKGRYTLTKKNRPRN